jgi:catechol 2,3-dioxygenase-like lactoylglutathione lyase family enzyme
MEATRLRYVIKFVADMDKAVKFYRDVMGCGSSKPPVSWQELASAWCVSAMIRDSLLLPMFLQAVGSARDERVTRGSDWDNKS